MDNSCILSWIFCHIIAGKKETINSRVSIANCRVSNALKHHGPQLLCVVRELYQKSSNKRKRGNPTTHTYNKIWTSDFLINPHSLKLRPQIKSPQKKKIIQNEGTEIFLRKFELIICLLLYSSYLCGKGILLMINTHKWTLFRLMLFPLLTVN